MRLPLGASVGGRVGCSQDAEKREERIIKPPRAPSTPRREDKMRKLNRGKKPLKK